MDYPDENDFIKMGEILSSKKYYVQNKLLQVTLSETCHYMIQTTNIEV